MFVLNKYTVVVLVVSMSFLPGCLQTKHGIYSNNVNTYKTDISGTYIRHTEGNKRETDSIIVIKKSDRITNGYKYFEKSDEGKLTDGKEFRLVILGEWIFLDIEKNGKHLIFRFEKHGDNLKLYSDRKTGRETEYADFKAHMKMIGAPGKIRSTIEETTTGEVPTSILSTTALQKILPQYAHIFDGQAYTLSPTINSNSTQKSISAPNNNTQSAIVNFHFTNSCNHPIRIAIHYRNLDNKWVSVGWWSFAPGEAAFLSSNKIKLKTSTARWYYYAQTTDDSNLVWKGDRERLFQENYLPMIALDEKKGDSRWRINCE